MERFKGKTVIVTGAGSGIGAATARRFSEEGASVVLCGRTSDKLEAVARDLPADRTLVHAADVADRQAVEGLVDAAVERFGRLDILVGNAAMLGDLSPVSHYAPKTWEKVFALNVTANYRLIRSLDRLLRGSDAGRAMFVTSGVARSPVAYFGAYAASKAALEMMVRMYAREVALSPLKVNLLDPGVVRTKMRAHGFPGEDPMIHPAPEEITDRFVELAEPACQVHGEVVSV